MESKNELYSVYSADILLNKRPYETYENILVYNNSCKTSTGPKPLRIRFYKIDEFIRVLDGEIKHLEYYLIMGCWIIL